MSCDRPAKAPEGPPPGDDLSRWLAAYDDALASGARPAGQAAAAPPGLGEDLDLLHLLDRLRPHQRPQDEAPAPPPLSPSEGERGEGAAAPDEEARYV